MAALAGAGVASAHATRIATDPVENAELTQAPPKVSATFNEALQPEFAAMTVVGPDGNLWSTGDPQVHGAVVSVGVRPLGPSGTYTVNYRVTSADGHVVSGSWSFRLTVAGTGTPGPSASRDEPIRDDGIPVWPFFVAAGGDRRRRRVVGGATADVTRQRAVAGGALVVAVAAVVAWALALPAEFVGATLVRAVADCAAVVALGLAVVPMLDDERYRGELIRRATGPLAIAGAIWLVAELVRLGRGGSAGRRGTGRPARRAHRGRIRAAHGGGTGRAVQRGGRGAGVCGRRGWRRDRRR